MSLRAWISSFTEDSVNKIATTSGVDQSYLNKQLKNETTKPNPETVVKIADAYKTSPIPGLVAIGLITKAHADAYHAEVEVRDIPWPVLLGEIKQRLIESGEWVD